jgi:predicted AAA+ superfamily ATPase
MRDCLKLLPLRVGNPLSINSIREDLEVAFDTTKRYLENLEQLFVTFSLTAYSKKIHRAVKKEKKAYFYHHPVVQDPGYRFENAIALALKKWARGATERALGEFEIHYLRDQDRREVDFLVVRDGKPQLLLEAKLSDTNPSPAGIHYSNKLKLPFVQIVGRPGVKRLLPDSEVAILSAHHLLAVLG